MIKKKLRIIRKPKIEKRELTEEETIKGIKYRIGSFAKGYIKSQTLEVYEASGRSLAIKKLKELSQYGGTATGGFMENGTAKGVRIQIFEGVKYSEREFLIAERVVPYSEVFDYILKDLEVKECKPKKKLIKRKLK